jgi:hypothetical protein
MKIRPRYSLLTLLVLTALIAGGVKYWRGPHRTVMNDPPTHAERKILKSIEVWEDCFEAHGVTFRYELEWRREWETERTLSLKLIPLQELTLRNFDARNRAQGKLLLTPELLRELSDSQRRVFETLETERVLCLLHRGRPRQRLEPDSDNSQSPAAGTATPASAASANSASAASASSVPELAPNPLYLLTNRKRVYELNGVSGGLAGKPVKPEDIVDLDLRSTVSWELWWIPDP